MSDPYRTDERADELEELRAEAARLRDDRWWQVYCAALCGAAARSSLMQLNHESAARAADTAVKK